MTEPHVTLSDITKSYGGVPAVRDVSFTIGRGEFVVLLGPREAARRPCCQFWEGSSSRLQGASGLAMWT